MDVSTDSDSDENVTAQSATHSTHVKNVPAFVAWQDSDGTHQSLDGLDLDMIYEPNNNKALIKLRASTRLKKGPAKPSIFLFIGTDQIRTIAYLDNEEDLGDSEEGQRREARRKLNTSTYALRFDLQSPAIFVVPSEYPFKFFRAGSQALWRSWKAFARGTLRFVVHIPMKSMSKMRLGLFCQAASRRGPLVSLKGDIASLYGGKGGRVVDPTTDEDTDAAEAEVIIPSCEDPAPPAYEERAVAGFSVSAVGPPLCLSPKSEPSHGRKRRRRRSSPDHEGDMTTDEKGNGTHDRILQCILRLEQTANEDRAMQKAILSKILSKVENIEHRICRLEEQQQNLAEEVEAHVEPLWDELSARLQSQEDREHEYIKDIVDEVFDQKIDEKMDDKIPEVVEQYLNDEDGQILINEVVGDRVHEETRDFLRSRHFTGHFTISESG